MKKDNLTLGFFMRRKETYTLKLRKDKLRNSISSILKRVKLIELILVSHIITIMIKRASMHQ